MPTTHEEEVMLDFGDYIEGPVFEQILDMDDDEEDRDFSREIVFGFFDQASTTFTEMDEALNTRDLERLSSLGHFLKGSSATLGFTRVKDECEKIQHFGQKKDESGTVDEPDETLCLRRITSSLAFLKRDYQKVEALMKRFYDKSAQHE